LAVGSWQLAEYDKRIKIKNLILKILQKVRQLPTANRQLTAKGTIKMYL
jgi:hypothetical protein